MCENRNNLSIVFWFLTTRQGKTIFKCKRSNWSFKRNGFRRQKAPFNCSEMQNNISSASINYFNRYFNFNNSWVLWLVWWGNHKLYFRAADWLVCVPRAGLESEGGRVETRNILLREKATHKWWKFWQITFSIDYNLYWKMSIDKGKFINYDLYFIYHLLLLFSRYFSTKI